MRLLQALQACGLRRLVLCPGSRSGPLAVAAGLLESPSPGAPSLDLLTAVDERSAAFLALGLGRADGHAAAVVTTSGTAVANLLPAAVEADHGAIPLLLLSADRPQRLKGIGANQTVNQERFLEPSARLALSGDPRGLAAMAPAALDALAQRAWAAAHGAPAGPVHLNLPLEEPLHAGVAELQQLAAAPRDPLPVPPLTPGAVSATPGPSHPSPPQPSPLDPQRPGAVVVGPWRGPLAALPAFAEALARWQGATGWPVLADGLSGLRGMPGLGLIHSYDLLLEVGHRLPPAPQLLRLGPMPASRRLQQWIAAGDGPQLLISEADPRNLDASASAHQRCGLGLAPWLQAQPPLPLAPSAEALAWAEPWRRADAAAQTHLDGLLQGGAGEPAIARALSRLLPPGLPVMLASSSPVRDWESFAAADAPQRPLIGFRGASGIDGTLSLAAGLALGTGSLVLVSGDLALLHDSNGWLWMQQLAQRGVRLTVVLIDNGGGGIFEQLPIRADGPLDFERLFAMPQAVDQLALAAAHGVPGRRLQDLAALPEALAWALPQPLALLELRTDRQADARLRQELRRRMAALHGGPDGDPAP
jgi:2-succinyl-5-enolpyruvyl-6-hydroxy-3-cyclohexene-1-carboxylate synthase